MEGCALKSLTALAPACTRRGLLRLGAATLAAAALPLPLALRAAPDEGYGALDLDWQDSVRQRPVPVRLYLPNGRQTVPLVLFSHGLGGTRRGYSWLGTNFAAHGVAALHVQHVGSDRGVWTGSAFGLVGRLRDAAREAEAIARAQDMRFALDTLLAGPWGARIDSRRIVAAGHSYGANTTLLCCGARATHDGRPVNLADARLRAAIVISAPPFYGQADPRRILAGVQVPSLHVTATEDVIRIPGYYSGAQDRLDLFDATAGPRKWLAVFEGGSHSMFTDRGMSGGAVLNPQVKAATQALVLAFLGDVLDGEGADLDAWPHRYGALLARFADVPG